MRQAPSIHHTLSALSPSSRAGARSEAPLRIHFPAATVSSPGVHLSKETTAVPPTFSVSAHALQHISLPNCDLSPTTSASSVDDDSASFATAQAAVEPEFDARGAKRDSTEGQDDDDDDDGVPRYMIVTLDLDAPFPSFPVMSPILHGIQADLVLDTAALDADQEFIPFQTLPAAGRKHKVGGRTVVRYMGPAPPPPSSPHRYVCMLWAQPGGLSGRKICEVLALSASGGSESEVGTEAGGDEAGEVGILERVRWDEEEFERKLGLRGEDLVGGNYFVC